MSSPSNLYAEKIFSEHPTVLWALDDQADYISLISENDRKVYNWTVTGGSATEDFTMIDEPFPSSSVTKLVGNVTSEDYSKVICISDEVFNLEDLNTYMATFSIGAYIYSNSPYISGIEIGYQYYDETTASTVEKLKNYGTSVYNRWVFVSETFTIPSEVAAVKLVLKINYIGGAESTDDYIFFVNGFTVGQWAEEFNSSSLGSNKISLPSSIALDTSFVIEAKSYGLQNTPGYYFVTDNALVAKNSGIPIVYGSGNTTILSPNDNKPSLIIPGYGFLNDSGKFKEYTLEMWLRVNSDSSTRKRIFGPISSTDGLYVDGPFILLKVGETFGSHYIGEWTRPMIVHIKYSSNSASLMINGEEVISLNILTSSLSFPKLLSESGKTQDWLGFYSYEDVSPVEVDCVSIYSYPVPSLVAKRRFVYGQGVEVPENINASYSGTSMFIDYPFADYSNNYMYPDLGSWSQASIDNLSVTNNFLTTKDYKLPEIFLSNKTVNELYDACKNLPTEDNLYLKLKPTGWSDTNGYLLFDDISMITSSKALYGIFKVSNIVGTKILFRIDNAVTKEYFSIELVGNKIKYLFKYEELLDGQSQTKIDEIYESSSILVGDDFVAGIDIPTFVTYYGGRLTSFFGNLSSAKLYVGGCKELTNTFDGNIYHIGFSSNKNFLSISHVFNSELGIPVDFENIFNLYSSQIDYDAGQYYGTNQYFWLYVLDGGSPTSFASNALDMHTATYTLSPVIDFDKFSLTIDIQGTWEDQIPLSYFAQYVTDGRGDSYYDLDFIQFNVNYPAPSIFLEEETEGEWTYGELHSQYSNPILRTYESLDNHLFTGYLDYNDLKNKSEKTYKYDTSNSLVKSYITFQYLETGANAPDSFFINKEKAPKIGIIDPQDDWLQTKYEIVDNMLIYPPTGANFNDLAIVVELNFKVKNVLKNKVQVKKLQLASQAFNDVSPNEIGTRFAVPIYPYRKTGYYYDFKNQNPFTIYKGSSPYLYLTRYSGIQVRGQYDPLVNRGIFIPINPASSSDYKVMAMQAAIRFDEDFFPYAPTQIFEIESKDYLIKFFMVASHPDGKRARIYAINAKTGQVEEGIGFYLNGKIVKDPTITIKEWSFLGISFSNLLDFTNYVGSIKINGPLLVNLVSHYKSTNLQEVQNVIERPWFRVKRDGGLQFDWQYWESAYIWQGVLVLSTTSYYGVKPSDIYKSYTGTNKIIVDDTREFRLNGYQYKVYADISWQSKIQNAV
jgi:hypothetical protein